MFRVRSSQAHEGGDSKEIELFSPDGMLMRRIKLSEKGELELDFTYAYDSKGRCMGGVILGKNFNFLGTFENLFLSDLSHPVEEVERNSNGEVLNRKKYFFDGSDKPYKVEFFSSDIKLGEGFLRFDPEGFLLSVECYDEMGRPVEEILLPGVIEDAGKKGTDLNN